MRKGVNPRYGKELRVLESLFYPDLLRKPMCFTWRIEHLWLNAEKKVTVKNRRNTGAFFGVWI